MTSGSDALEVFGSQAGAARDAVTEPAVVGFREVNNPDAWRIEVVIDGAVSGHIYRGGGTYRYFEGPHNDVIWSLAELDLERLETRIRATVLGDSPAGRPGSQLVRQPE